MRKRSPAYRRSRGSTAAPRVALHRRAVGYDESLENLAENPCPAKSKRHYQPSLLESVRNTEKKFLAGKRDRGADLESAVRVFLEFLRGYESLDFEAPCVTVFGSRDSRKIIVTTSWLGRWGKISPRRDS